LGQRDSERKHYNITIRLTVTFELSWLLEKARGKLNDMQNREETAAGYIARVTI